MQNTTVVIVILLAAAAVSFLLGRTSAVVLRDRRLEAKRGELMGIKAGLDEVAESLTRREQELRSSWQEMVVDASEVLALAGSSEGTWTADDDRFLNSWSSAEKATGAKE